MILVLVGLCIVLGGLLVWTVVVCRKLRDRYELLTLKFGEAAKQHESFKLKFDEANQLRQSLKVKWEAATQQCELLKVELHEANLQRESFKLQLEEAARKLAEIETSSKPEGLFQKAVAALVGLGVPGLVLLAVMATSGFAGAAAITSALATLGGPAGMIGGIAALIALGLASKAIAQYGYPKVAEAVVRGLITKGESKESIRRKLDAIPRWIISQDARAKAMAAVDVTP